MGKRGASIEHARRAAAVYQETGDLHNWGQATDLLAVGLGIVGSSAQALVHARDMVRSGQDGADPQVECWGLTTQGAVLWRLWCLVEAIVALQAARELAKAIPTYSEQIVAWGLLGRCLLRQGQLAQALSALRRGQQICDEHGAMAGERIQLDNGLAEAYLLAAEQSDALRRSERADWLKKAKRACRVALRVSKAYRPGLPEAMRLRGTYEWLRRKPKAAQKWWQRSLALAEEMGQRYDLGTTHLEMGRRLGERTHLERAEAILAEIGAEWDLARVREALSEM